MREGGIVMKKIIVSIISIVMIFTCVGCSNQDSKTTGDYSWPAMSELQSLSASDITMIEYIRATEGGATEDQIVDEEIIEDIYLRLKEVTIKEESDMGVEDDGLGITITTNDKTLVFDFEGDILILEDGKRYEVENLHSLKSTIDSLIEEKYSMGPDSNPEPIVSD